MHACTLKCILMFVQSTLYGVGLLYKKKEQLASVLMKETGNICVCAVASSPAEVHPALAEAQRRVTQISSGKSAQTGPHRHPQAHKHAESRTRSSAGAKVNRWAGLNWLAVCSDCKLRWWWLENSSTGCRLLKLSRENNFLLCSGNFFFSLFPSSLQPPPLTLATAL